MPATPILLAIAVYLLAMNLLAFVLMASDKKKAKSGAWRVPEKVLFLSAILGGSIGAIVGMQVFRHKTKHWYFKYGMPAILILQMIIAICVWYYIYNR